MQDQKGNETTVTDFGRTGQDTPISTVRTWQLPANDLTGWSHRVVDTVTSATDSSGGTLQGQAREYRYGYNSLGQLTSIVGNLSLSVPLAGPNGGTFAAGQPPDASVASNSLLSLATISYDAYGNVVAVQRPNARCTAIAYDSLFAQLPITTTVYSPTCPTSGQTTPALMTSTRVYDRGLERVTQQTAPSNGVVPHITMMRYDAFGRIAEVDEPMVGFAGAADTTNPALLVQYTDTGPIRQILRKTIDGPASAPVATQHYQYIDGFGDILANLDQAGPAQQTFLQWTLSGAHTRHANGLVHQLFKPTCFPGAASAFNPATYDYSNGSPDCQAPSGTTPARTFTYDALGRLVTSTDFANNQTTRTYHAGAFSVDVQDPEQVSNGRHPGALTTFVSDGHGRTTSATQQLVDNGSSTVVFSAWTYLPTGEVTSITQEGTAGAAVRTMQYDTLGRMVSQSEPNTGTWRYAYNDTGELVGMSDARGCGEVLYHDALGRLQAEDYSPCDSAQAAYTAPNFATGDGTEAFNQYDGYGQLAHAYDRAQRSTYSYDGRGRLTRVQRQIATPTGGSALATRYAPQVFTKAVSSYDAANRPVVTTTGTDLADLQVNGVSSVTTAYTAQGTLASVSSSYGTLIASQLVDASGATTQRQYGDAAQTTAQMGYDANEAVLSYALSRAAQNGSGWAPYTAGTSATASDRTYESALTSVSITRDKVGNPIGVTYNTSANPSSQGLPNIQLSEWAPGSGPVASQTLTYGSDYRLVKAQTQYAGDASWSSPYTPAESATYPLPEPVPQDLRVQQQTYAYDFRGNLTQSGDDQSVFWDRSLGTMSTTSGTDQLVQAGPNSNAQASVSYDGAGNTSLMNVVTPGHGRQQYVYSWDELGRLSTADRRNTSVGGSIDERFMYDADGNRVSIARTTFDPNGQPSPTRYTVNVFDSLVLENAAFPDSSGTNYEHDDATEHLYLSAAGELLGHVFRAQTSMPSASGNVHMFMPMGDRLGSTSFVIDHDTGEVVEATTYQAYGAVDSDFRPARWNAFREDIRYASHWDDAEVGLVYMNARYYSPQLGRFISPDPLTIHGLAGDPNPYAYVRGSPARYVDPLGYNIFSEIGSFAIRLVGGGNGPDDHTGPDKGGNGGSLPSSAPATWGWGGVTDPATGVGVGQAAGGVGTGGDGSGGAGGGASTRGELRLHPLDRAGGGSTPGELRLRPVDRAVAPYPGRGNRRR